MARARIPFRTGDRSVRARSEKATQTIDDATAARCCCCDVVSVLIATQETRVLLLRLLHSSSIPSASISTMKSPSTPLFDAPFAHADQQRTPLRRRENDSFAAPTYGELPRRRRRAQESSTERLIRFGMKAILLSPVVVLVIWSVVLAVSTPKSSPSRSAVHIPVRPKKDVIAPLGAPQHIPIFAPLGAASQAQSSLATPLDATFVRPRPQPHPRGPLVVQPPIVAPPTGMTGMMQSQPVLMAAQYASEQTPLMAQAPVMMAPQQGVPQQVMNPPQQLQLQEQTVPFLVASQQQQLPSPPQQQVQLPQPPQQLEQLPQPPQQLEQIPPPPQQQEQVRYYYYDPALTKQDASGNLILPATVYDPEGRPVPLARLQQESADPPKTVFHHDSYFNNSNYTHLNITYSHPTTVKTGKHREAAFATPTFASQPTDQSIIVGTVGIMALLVGALSARRLRSRGILQVCLDDEQLQDEAAYDTAYTVQNYSTFAWKGDLEKFDV
jgi:hypothetical protein